MNQILLPVESLDTAKPVLDYLVNKNRRERCWIHLLNVQPPVMAGEVSHVQSLKAITGARIVSGKEVLRPIQRLLEAEGVGHAVRIVLGEPAEAIVSYAAEQGCTSIVMSTRGMSALGSLVLGSVATKVVKLTDIPVTLIRRPREAAIAALLRRSDREPYHARHERRMETQDVIQGQ